MNHLNIETIQTIITNAVACYPNNGEARVISLSDIPIEDLINERPELEVLRESISSLSLSAFAELQSLMILGRGASGEEASDWDSLVSHHEASYSGVSTNEYIIRNSQLAVYLNSGLQKLSLI